MLYLFDCVSMREKEMYIIHFVSKILLFALFNLLIMRI